MHRLGPPISWKITRSSKTASAAARAIKDGDCVVIDPGDAEASSEGLWWHRLSYIAASARDGIRHIGGGMLRGAKSLIRG